MAPTPGVATGGSVEEVASLLKTPAADMARYRLLVERAVDVFGDELTASRWLSRPNADFAGKSPLQVAQTANYDLNPLEPVLTRIEHGIYS